MADLIRTDGFIRFPSQLSPEHCDQLISDIFSLQPEKRWNDGFPAPGPDQKTTPHLTGTAREGVHVTGDYHLKNMWNRHVDFLQLVDQPNVIDTVEAVMGADAHIIGLTGWVTGPGRPDQTLHTDYLPLEIPEDILLEGRVTMPVMIMTAHYCASQARISSFVRPCTYFSPSHCCATNRLGRCRRRAWTNKVHPELAHGWASAASWRGQLSWCYCKEHPGSQRRLRDVQIVRCCSTSISSHTNAVRCKMLSLPVCHRLCPAACTEDSDVWHRGSKNTSNRERHIIQVHYGNRWTDNRRKYSDPNSGESYDVFFPVNPEIFAAATPRQRRIIGCHAGGPFG